MRFSKVSNDKLSVRYFLLYNPARISVYLFNPGGWVSLIGDDLASVMNQSIHVVCLENR